MSAQYFGVRAKLRYEVGDWLSWPVPLQKNERYDLITVFFPYLFKDLHSGAGLPSDAFEPQEFYKKAFRYGTRVLFLHQGEEEARESERLIRRIGNGEILLQAEAQPSGWLRRKHPVQIILWGVKC